MDPEAIEADVEDLQGRVAHLEERLDGLFKTPEENIIGAQSEHIAKLRALLEELEVREYVGSVSTWTYLETRSGDRDALLGGEGRDG